MCTISVRPGIPRGETRTTIKTTASEPKRDLIRSVPTLLDGGGSLVGFLVISFVLLKSEMHDQIDDPPFTIDRDTLTP